jgi:hypothetical protein
MHSEPVDQSTEWGSGKRLIFRFFFIYFIIYIFPFPDWMSEQVFIITDDICKKFRGINYQPLIRPAGSGDTTYNFIQFFASVAFSAFAAMIWTLFARKQKCHDRLFYWLTIFLRYYLGVLMIEYGLAKLFGTQFISPGTDVLMQSYGDSSPMRLLWTFMGFSKAYNMFTGLAEVVGGFLLFFKRTRLLGALIVIAVMSNVVMLNFTYDVPVKLFSLHLFAIAVFLVAPYTDRLMGFFLKNKPIAAEVISPIYTNAKFRLPYFFVKGTFIIAFFAVSVAGQIESRKEIRQYQANGGSGLAFYGDYDVKSFVISGDTLGVSQQPTVRWKKLRLAGRNANITYMDNASLRWHLVGDQRMHRLILISDDGGTIGNFSLDTDGTHMVIEGKMNESSIKVSLKKTANEPSYLLLNRGFHWINEYPYNQ